MKPPAPWLVILSAAVVAPLALVVSAILAGLWQRRPSDLAALLDEDQLGT